MKTIFIGLCFLSLTSLAHAQDSPVNPMEIPMNTIASVSKNSSYFNAVHNVDGIKHVENLQKAAHDYDLLKAMGYTRNYENYEVAFRNNEGSILATYNNDGELIKTVEKYDHARLPISVLKTLKQNYSGWHLNKASYRVAYCKNKVCNKFYLVQIHKDQKKLNLKIDCKGKIINHKNKQSLG